MEIKNRQLISLLVFIVTGILLFDNNCFIKKPVHTILKEKKIEISAGRSSSNVTFFLVDSSGNKYKVPGGLYHYLTEGDSLLCTRSLIFNKAIRISYLQNGIYIKEDIGVLNADGFGKGFPVFCMLLCLLSIFFHNRIVNERLRIGAFFFPIMFLLVIVAFYFFFST